MHKINQTIKNKLNNLLKILVLILLILFNTKNIVYAANINWIEVSKTPTGIQYLDRESIDIKGKGIIELTTKYLKIDSNNSKVIEENIYIMKINCLTNKFKDISVNGKKNLTAKWEDPDGDKLLDDVISDSCENV
ncbi:hypothetical protein [Prochlorococcus sp. MIT 0916]|uniref:hypothetical protein n=1 Tax=Prochlorococcus sp. MIT 0916 TaxID=3082521 RepID=UPI0039B5D155